MLEVRDDYVVPGETFFDQDGKPVRRMITDKVGALGGRPYPTSMTMHPLDRARRSGPGSRPSSGQFNAALPDYLFTLSNLQNPRS